MPMTPNEITAVIGLVGAQIVGPIVAYSKTREAARVESERINAERATTAARRDTEHQLLKQEVEHLKAKISEIEGLREIMHEVKNSVSKIEALLPLLTKLLEGKT